MNDEVPDAARAAPLAAILADANPEAVAAYSLFRRVPGAEAVLPLPPHMEFLIDRSGYLRARAIPGEGPGWHSLADLELEIAALEHEPPHPPPQAEAHMH
jgi:putative copper resistance protein D